LYSVTHAASIAAPGRRTALVAGAAATDTTSALRCDTTSVTESPPDPLYPNRADDRAGRDGVSRRHLLASGATASAVAAAGCAGNGRSDDDTAASTEPGDEPTVFVFNTGDGTVSLIDPATNEVVGSRAIGLSSSFPSNQYTPTLTDAATDLLWLNVDRGVRALTAGGLEEAARIDTGSGANWQEQTPDGSHVVVSAREPSHTNYRVDADRESETFGEVTGELDRGGNDGPGPCDVTIHPDGEYAYVPDLFGDTLTVLSIDPFEIETQIDAEGVVADAAAPWMATIAPDGETMLVEHNEGEGTESIWDCSDPTNPTERTRLTTDDGLGRGALTSEIGPDSETGYVFTPGSNDLSVIDLAAGTVTDRLDLGGSAFVGTWNPAKTKLYVPVQTNDEVAVIDHAAGEIVDRIDVGPSPYGATAATVRPPTDSTSAAAVALARLGLAASTAETTYCIGKCACGHEL
jgi:YVTN family beta-propeller protein